MNKFYIGDIFRVISEEEVLFVIPFARRYIQRGEFTRGGEVVEFFTIDFDSSKWPQEVRKLELYGVGQLGLLRFDDLEPEYQKRAERDVKEGYAVIFWSKAKGVGELSHVELMAQGFWGKWKGRGRFLDKLNSETQYPPIDTTTLAQTLTCAEALVWLEGALHNLDNENLDPDRAMSAILEREWKKEDEFLEFFKQISIELAMTATQSDYQSTASLFGVDLPFSLGFDSPYQKLWEKALHINSQKFEEQISSDNWQNTCIDAGHEWPVLCLIPLATLFEKPLFEQLKLKSIKSLTPDQEKFLDYVEGCSSDFDGDFPVELINIPSSKILYDLISYTWFNRSELWVPDVIKKLLESDYVDNKIKAWISSQLKCEGEVEEEEEWQSHLEKYWTSEDIEQVLTSCN